MPDPTYYTTTPTHVTVNLAPGENKVVNFGLDWPDPEIPEVPK
jgi:hypothetical protein